MKFFIVFTILIGSMTGYADVTTYDYPAPVERSDKYEVSVTQGDRTQTAFVHITHCPDKTFKEEKIHPFLWDRTFSWTNFSFDNGPVEVTVKKLFGEGAKNVIISPKRFGIRPGHFTGDTVRFTMEKPEYISIRFLCPENSDEYDQIKHGLMIFADVPETDIPDLSTPGVIEYDPEADLFNAQTIVFKPGFHDLCYELPNGMLPVHDNQSVYIAGGAYILGGITGPTTVNVKVYGRGVLSGRKQPFH
ncbi:MAG: hypothetical protein MI922_25705, partial [Bacteroidales bacterium]|nr:hypothetical protein [Bacteroidales bacterium]